MPKKMKPGPKATIPDPNNQTPNEPAIFVSNERIRNITGSGRVTKEQKEKFGSDGLEIGWDSFSVAEAGVLLMNEKVAKAHTSKHDGSGEDSEGGD